MFILRCKNVKERCRKKSPKEGMHLTGFGQRVDGSLFMVHSSWFIVHSSSFMVHRRADVEC